MKVEDSRLAKSPSREGYKKEPYAYILQSRHTGVKFLKITDLSLSTKN